MLFSLPTRIIPPLTIFFLYLQSSKLSLDLSHSPSSSVSPVLSISEAPDQDLTVPFSPSERAYTLMKKRKIMSWMLLALGIPGILAGLACGLGCGIITVLSVRLLPFLSFSSVFSSSLTTCIDRFYLSPPHSLLEQE